MIDPENREQVLRLVLSSVFTSVLLGRGSSLSSPDMARVCLELADALLAGASKPTP